MHPLKYMVSVNDCNKNRRVIEIFFMWKIFSLVLRTRSVAALTTEIGGHFVFSSHETVSNKNKVDDCLFFFFSTKIPKQISNILKVHVYHTYSGVCSD